MEDIRVRFAPSPTGSLHIGGARTALFNWLFARHHGGKMVLRLEDTDMKRSTQSSADGIIDGLRWLGLDWDEGPDIGGPYGPYRQSERQQIYQKYIQQLLREDKAYYCFCPEERIEALREKARQKKTDYRYDGHCRQLSLSQAEQRIQAGQKPVVRLKIPCEGDTVVQDLIRGQVHFSNRLLDDFIIQKSDGNPTYNFAVVVDDYCMHISHVIRAEEHLSNTPKQLLIYQALGWEPPQFAHVSMILAPDRSKLSKRHGATSVQEFRQDGYLPQALVNYLALLGWSPGEDITLMSVPEMIATFDLDHVSKAAAIYDIEKLTWMNGHYISESPPDDISQLLQAGAKKRGWLTADNHDYFMNVVKLLQPRIKTLNEFYEAAVYFFEEFEEYDSKGLKKHFFKPESIERLTAVAEIVKDIEPYDQQNLETALRQQAQEMGIKAGDLIHPTRLAISGRSSTPGIFELMELLGRDLCLQRINKAISYIEANKMQLEK